MNKIVPIFVVFGLIAGVAWIAHDLRSGALPGGLDDTSRSAVPSITPTPESTPIVQVDPTVEGTMLTVNGHSQKQTVTCTKLDRVAINGSGTVATINGTCRQIMVNGDHDQITADASREFVFNGSGNRVTYTRFVNGKIPSIVDNAGENDVQNVPFRLQTTQSPQGNKTK